MVHISKYTRIHHSRYAPHETHRRRLALLAAAAATLLLLGLDALKDLGRVGLHGRVHLQ